MQTNLGLISFFFVDSKPRRKKIAELFLFFIPFDLFFFLTERGGEA